MVRRYHTSSLYGRSPRLGQPRPDAAPDMAATRLAGGSVSSSGRPCPAGC